MSEDFKSFFIGFIIPVFSFVAMVLIIGYLIYGEI